MTPLADLGLDCEVRLSESVVGEADYLVKFQFDGFDGIGAADKRDIDIVHMSIIAFDGGKFLVDQP